MLAKFQSNYFVEVTVNKEKNQYEFTVYDQNKKEIYSGWTEYRSMELFNYNSEVEYVCEFCNISGVRGAYMLLKEQTMEEYIATGDMEYTLSNGDIQQLINRYENAKAKYKKQGEEGDPEWQFECGRAYALEGVLRMIGLPYDEVVKEQGICR